MVQQCTVDVIGVILDVGLTSQLTLRDGTEKDKRLLTIIDESKVSIGVTLWGCACESHNFW